MNDHPTPGATVAGTEATGRKSFDNHAQTVRNLRRILRNAAASARLIQAEGLDSNSAADLATSLAHALEVLTGSSAASIDGSDATSYRITTGKSAPPSAGVAIVKSYGDILREYRTHPEYKFNGPDGQPCRRNTRGLLQRRPVHLEGRARLIGKEANNIDEVQAGRYAQLDEIITEYHDPNDDHFHEQVMRFLQDLSAQELAHLVGAHRRTIHRIRRGQTPRPELRQALTQLAKRVVPADS